MLELFFVRILRQQENLGVKKPNNCSYSFRLQVVQSGIKVLWQRGSKGCPDPIPNNCSPKPEPGHWAAGPAGRKANNYSQFWRLQVWALGQVIPNNNSFSWPRQVRTRTKKPRAVKLGAWVSKVYLMTAYMVTLPAHIRTTGVQNSIFFLTLGSFAWG